MAKITSTKFTIDGAKITGALHKHIYAKMKAIAPEIAAEAQATHRYKNQTGNLTRSTKYWVRKTELTFAVYTARTAPYAKFIIGGTRHWKPDPYIEAAFARNKKWIDSQLQGAVSAGIREFNSLNRL